MLDRHTLTATDHYANRVRSEMQQVIDGLQNMVSQCESELRRVDHARDNMTQDKLLLTGAYKMQHEVIWGFANLGLDNLTDAAVKLAVSLPEDERKDIGIG